MFSCSSSLESWPEFCRVLRRSYSFLIAKNKTKIDRTVEVSHRTRGT